MTINRLVLGTAALGLPYGLPVAGGDGPRLVPEDDAARLVARALALGLPRFDTAPAYGVAEERLGRILAGTGTVWTKADHRLRPGPTLEGDLLASLVASLGRLRRTRIDAFQWHNWTRDLAEDRSFRAAWSTLGGDPRVGVRGCSTYGIEDAVAAVESGLFGLVQVEGNLLNPRVLDAVAGPARARGVAIAVRSVFLQGVLTPKGAALPPHLAALAPWRARAEARAADLGLPLTHLALRAVLDHPAVSWVLVGLDGLDQLQETVAGASGPVLDEAHRASLAALMVDDPALTDPRTWART